MVMSYLYSKRLVFSRFGTPCGPPLRAAAGRNLSETISISDLVCGNLSENTSISDLVCGIASENISISDLVCGTGTRKHLSLRRIWLPRNPKGDRFRKHVARKTRNPKLFRFISEGGAKAPSASGIRKLLRRCKET